MNKILQEIDSDMYILKNKIMCLFDKNFSTNLCSQDADSLRFSDILKAPHDFNHDEVYSKLKQIAKHGISSKQKKFLYETMQCPFRDNGFDDFDTFIGNIEETLQPANMQCDVVWEAKNESKGLTFIFNYHTQHLRYLECFVESDTALDVILIQNGEVLILSSTNSLEQLRNKLKNES